MMTDAQIDEWLGTRLARGFGYQITCKTVATHTWFARGKPGECPHCHANALRAVNATNARRAAL